MPDKTPDLTSLEFSPSEVEGLRRSFKALEWELIKRARAPR
jgi:hypothetical protein